MTPLVPSPTLRQTLAGFTLLALKTAATKLVYRLATLLTLLASALAYGVFLCVWLEVYRRNPQASPLGRQALVGYLVGAFLVNALLILTVENRFMQRVRMGLVATDLLRPIGFLGTQLGQATGDLLVNALYVLPLYAVGLWFAGRALAPPDAAAVCLGVLSIVLAFLIAFGLSYLIVQASFVLQSGYGVLFARAALHQVFSGLSAPLVLFPPLLRRVALCLPFHHEIETPVRIWLGQATRAELGSLLFSQAAWGFGLIGAGELLFRAVMRRQQIQGG